MERFTKLWFYNQNPTHKQRDVQLMKQHWHQYGITGNCFDLAIWLLHEFQQHGIRAYPIGHHLFTEDAHVAVIAEDHSGNRFLCDLGDQWTHPILIEPSNTNFTSGKLSGFFPAADIQVNTKGHQVEILYHRPNGKISKQTYSVEPLNQDTFMQAAEHSQNSINPKPLLECRVPYQNEIAHWEFNNWRSFLSTSEGLFEDPAPDSIQEWARLIHQKTGYDLDFLNTVLLQFRKLT
ncbi:hypothetical protein [Aquisalibacillus elongatus]|nr:hypothetical protein [Aquisalibacillus elongatus]